MASKEIWIAKENFDDGQMQGKKGQALQGKPSKELIKAGLVEKVSEEKEEPSEPPKDEEKKG